ncbi:hypothetical protein Tco_1271364, partial [Tanacetum coccineum]
MENSFKNNLLHLAERLKPPIVLSCTTGGALQLLRELQWCEVRHKYIVNQYVALLYSCMMVGLAGKCEVGGLLCGGCVVVEGGGDEE